MLNSQIVALAGLCIQSLLFAQSVFAQSGGAYKIGGKETSYADVYKEDQADFYEVEEKKYGLIERSARQKYLDFFFSQKAEQNKQSVDQARREYVDKNVKVSDKEMKETMDKFKDHPQLKSLPKEEQERQIRDFLKGRSESQLMDKLVEEGMKKGDLVILYPKPQEPVYEVVVNEKDHVRYGPKPSDTKPAGCSSDCPITIVEYSEFQCPFCEKVMPDVKRVLSDYKGKLRWITRDFPLSFHDRAKPAAVAAHCAGDQGKFWDFYTVLFENQKALQDADFEKYAGNVKLDMGKWKECVKNPAPKLALIESNIQSGAKVGVSGTPAFYINGRRLSGALPYSEFKRVIDDELRKSKKS